MNTIDIIIVILLVPAIYKGITNGLIRQASGIIGILLGIFLTREFSDLVATYLHNWIHADESIVRILSFALIMIAVLFGVNLIGKLVEKIFQFVMMGWLNRLLGIVFALGTAVILLSLAASLITYTNENWFTLVPQEMLSESKLFGILQDVYNNILPFLQFKN